MNTVPFEAFVFAIAVAAALGYAVASTRRGRPGLGESEPSGDVPGPGGRGPSRVRAGDRTDADPAAVDPGDAAPEGRGGPDVPRLYEIAQTLEAGEANSFADPHDIIGLPLFEEGVDMLTDPDTPLEQVVGYALGTNWVLGIMASEALSRRDDAAPAVDRVLDHIGQTAQWPLFFRLRFLVAHAERPVVGAVLCSIEGWWKREPVTVAAVDEFVEGRVARGEALGFDGRLADLLPERVDDVADFVRLLREEHAAPLLAEIEAHRQGSVDPEFASSAGRLWPGPVEGPTLHATATLEALLAEMREALGERPPRSVVVVGDSGVGKTALRRLFSAELVEEHWRIFETSGSELLSGTRYVGDIETRVGELRRNASVSKRVALFVDRLGELATAGRSQQHPVSVLDQLWPLLESRQVFLVAEAGPEALQHLVRRFPSLPTVLKVVRVPGSDEKETGGLAERLLSDADATQDPAPIVAEALHLARSYLSHRALPGSALALVRSGLARASAAGDRSLRRDHLLGALSEATGLPVEVLDDEARLDVEELRSAFRRRVIGQDEAVDCLVERVAMLKAGLTDPLRPIGVYLFAGPTGTGKTEIAKALAELLFGSPDHMIRLDMSEFQTPDSLVRLVGRPEEGESTASLVQQIRQRPFSVVLLDEFEKAHENVWDLFLQVFDDGRLTDRQGVLADFRHAIIILTSNLGSTIANEAGIGFVGTAGQFSSTEVLKAVNRTFRREFINRLDKVVVFRALSREVMRLILSKELEQALTRRGFRSKAWAVEWEDSAVEYLLAEGFTPDLGARPLRRAIERHLLAPLSMTIVENRTPEGEQFLFVRSDGDRLEVEFVDPNAEPDPGPAMVESSVEQGRTAADGAGLTVRALVARASGAEAEEAFLSERVGAIAERLDGSEWRAAKAAGLAEINADGFWERADRYDVLDRVELMDRIESAAAGLRSLGGRMARSHRSASLNRRVAEKLYVLEHGLADLDEGRPTLAYLGVRPLGEDAYHPEAAAFFDRVVEMYRAWAGRRRMQWRELRRVERVPGSAVIASVGGFGCHAILARETGLHVLEVPADESRFERVRVRVVVAPQLAPPNLPEAKLLEDARAALRAGEEEARAVVRRYRERPSPLVRDAPYGWRTGRVEAIWAGDFDVQA